MRDNIEKILALQGCDGYDAIGEILSLLAPVFEKAGKYDKDTALDEAERDRFIKLMDAEQGKDRADAEKWRKVKEIAKRNWYDGYPCDGCPVENCCDSADSLCGQADALVQALTEKEPT